MNTRYSLFILSSMLWTVKTATAQEIPESSPTSGKKAGWFSIGARNTISTFSDEGFGLGSGGQFRIQLSNKVNTDWFLDYIIINDKNVRSQYLHIGWSVLFYPFEKMGVANHKIQPYILAGHCFDYNQKTVLSDPSITDDRWGSAVQTGIGTHFNLSDRFDLTLMIQYMIHLTSELEVVESGGIYSIEKQPTSALQGHSLNTLSLNYKLFKLWGK